ncbi:hypothetical protein D3C73_768660 [compost metagenome]
MSIQNELKETFKAYTSQIEPSKRLDARIHKLYRKQIQSKGAPTMNLQQKILTLPKRRLIPSIIAACVLFSGVAYASNLLVNFTTSQVNYQVSTNSLLNLDSETTERLRQHIQTVKMQLAPGENAYVYLAEMDRLKLPALQKVTNPELIKDINQWKQLTSQKGTLLKIPSSLPADFAFDSASLQGSMSLISPTEYKEHERTLKKQAKQSADGVAWAKSSTVNPQVMNNQTPVLTYSNKNQGTIEVIYQLIPSTDKVVGIKQMVSDHSIAEPVQVWGADASYLVNPSNIFSAAGNTSTVQWLEKVDGATIIYTISTTSPEVSKEDLLLVANSMK